MKKDLHYRNPDIIFAKSSQVKQIKTMWYKIINEKQMVIKEAINYEKSIFIIPCVDNNLCYYNGL